jgi:hypothetical protein
MMVPFQQGAGSVEIFHAHKQLDFHASDSCKTSLAFAADLTFDSLSVQGSADDLRFGGVICGVDREDVIRFRHDRDSFLFRGLGHIWAADNIAYSFLHRRLLQIHRRICVANQGL